MSQGQKYALPLYDVLHVLRASSQHAYRVQADIPASRLSIAKRGVCRADLLMHDGQVVSSAIFDQTHRVCLEGKDAFEAICSLEDVIWVVFLADSAHPSLELGAFSPPVEGSSGPALFSSPPPHLSWTGRSPPYKVSAMQAVAKELPDRHLRLLWLLIDGQHTVADLARLLHLSQEEVGSALTGLETRGLITADPLDRR